MQSLVATVPMLHWEEEGEPEDTVDGMLGRALTYLVLFSTLGMFLRWSVGAKLLSSIDEEAEQEQQPAVPTGQLIDHQQSPDGPISANGSSSLGNGAEGRQRPQRKRTGPQGWAVSFPNSPVSSDDEDEAHDAAGNGQQSSSQSSLRKCGASLASFNERFILTPIRAINNFMTAPLWAAILSLVVAVIAPLQHFIGSLEPVVGALETAGGCSIPLTMVILGAYFHSEPQPATKDADKPVQAPAATQQGAAAESTVLDSTRPQEPEENDWRDEASSSSRGWATTFNPWSSSSASRSAASQDPEEATRTADERTRLLPSTPAPSAASRRRSSARSKENWTIAIAIASRMLITPLVLVPLIAWYAIATRCEPPLERPDEQQSC